MLDLFFSRMKNLLNDEYENFVEALEKPAYQSIHINTNKDQTSEIANKFQLQPHPYVKHGYYFNKEEIQLGKLPYHEAGLYYIQEPSAMLVSELAEIKPGMKVLDMCAAPGGKSTKAGLLVGDDGLLICNDISNSRAKILSENIERFGLKNTLVSNVDPVIFGKYLPEFFDVIIVDAPCSGEGMFRKLNQAKTTWSIDKVKECADIQRNLIEAAYECLKPGGTLVYSTCTYELEENEDQITYALNNYDFDLIPIEMKEGFSSILEGTIRLYPHKFNGEGHFIAKLQKRGTSDENYNYPQIKSNLNATQKKLVQDFYKDTLNLPVPACLFASQEHIYAIPSPYLDLKKIRFLRQGLYLGECKKNRFEPSLSLALSLKPSEAKRCYNFSNESEEIEKYIHGDTLEGNLGDGFGLICIDGKYPIGFVKEVKGVLKNFYPKGKRR